MRNLKRKEHPVEPKMKKQPLRPIQNGQPEFYQPQQHQGQYHFQPQSQPQFQPQQNSSFNPYQQQPYGQNQNYQHQNKSFQGYPPQYYQNYQYNQGGQYYEEEN